MVESRQRMIVVLKPGNILTGLLQSILLNSIDATLLHTFSSTINGIAISIPDPTGYLAAVAILLSNPSVQCVIPDTRTLLHGQVSQTASLAGGETVPAGVKRIEAASDTAAAGTVTATSIAIVDTGIDLQHPDLTSAKHGINCLSKSSQAQDDNGHGTAVAGVIAASNTGSGIVGVAPGTTVYAVKVADSTGYAWNSDVICGLDWIAKNRQSLHISVAQMSLGFSGVASNTCNLDPLHTAITSLTNAGVLTVVSAGNNDQPIASAVPASYNEVLVATAMTDVDGVAGGLGGAASCSPGDSDDTAASYSNYNVGSKDNIVAAPGTCVYSTYLRSISSYTTITGTSFAAPHVSGVVALCIQNGQCANKSPEEIKSIIVAAANSKNNAGGYGFSGSSSLTYYGPLVYANAF